MSVNGVSGVAAAAESYRLLLQQTSATCSSKGNCEAPNQGAAAAASSRSSGDTDESGEILNALRSQIDATLEKFLKKWLQDKPEKKTESASSSTSESDAASETEGAADAAAAATETTGQDEESKETQEAANKGIDFLSRFRWALAEILQTNGLEPGSVRGQPPGPPPKGPPPVGQPPVASHEGGETSPLSAALTSRGIDAEEFRRNLMTAIQGINANGRQLDYSKVFAGFPSGASLDLLA